MSDSTAISWCDATFNPWWGCTKVSPACDHCYAERDAKRFASGMVLWGFGAERRTFDDAHWQQPLKWAKRAFEQCSDCGWRGMHTKLRHVDGEHECPSCGSKAWRAACLRVFCASMGDWLDLDAPLAEFVRLLDTIRLTPELDWLLLTKRIGNWRKRLDAALAAIDARPEAPALWDWISAWLDGNAPANVWLGATVVNQEEADRDIPKLLAVPARVRFLSIEPILSAIDLRLEARNDIARWDGLGRDLPLRRIDWVIAGGESGPHARPAHPDWFRSLRDQCAAAGVPFHFKQWGEWSPGRQAPWITNAQASRHLFVELEHQGCTVGAFKCGKAAAGRLLDGVEHNGFPA